MLTVRPSTGVFLPRPRRASALPFLAALLALAALSVVPARAGAFVTSGALSQLGEPSDCIGEAKEEVAKCGTTVPFGLSFAYQVQVSPDSKNAYSVAVNGDLIEYSRNLANGELTVIGCFSSAPSSEPCATGSAEANAEMEVSAAASPAAIALSPDGASAYVITQGASNSVVEFSRDPETGLLTKIGCITNEAVLSGCATTNAKGLSVPYGVTVSPDGENVYVTGFGEKAVAEFKRNSEGVLTQLAFPDECIGDAGSGCGTTAIGLKEDVGIAVSPDGENVYVAAGTKSTEGDIAAFARGAEGALTQLSGEEACIGESVTGCTKGAEAKHIEGTEDLVVSPDGKNVYANSYLTNSVIELTRTGSGALKELASPNECVSTEALTGCQQVEKIGGAFGVAISPGGEDLYVASANENAVAAFERNSTSGVLKQLTGNPCVTEQATGCGGPEFNERVGLDFARRLTVSPDGTNVYVAGQAAHAIVELARAVKPTVTSVGSTSGSEAGGTEVEIEGSGFITGATVHFGSKAATSVTVHSASSLTATTPPESASKRVEVTVTTSSGTSEANPDYHFKWVHIPPKLLGGMDVAGYCASIGYPGDGGSSAGLLRGEVEGSEGSGFAYGNWSCVESDGHEVEIKPTGSSPSMDDLCAHQYSGVASYAYPSDPDNAFTWSCYESPPVESGCGTCGGQTAKTSSLVTPIATIASVVIPPPVLAHTGNVAPVSGTVSVKVPGTSRFVPLSSLQSVPYGTVINATNGTVSVTSILPDGKIQTGEFFEGEFVLTQERDGNVVATLTGGSFSVCPTKRERAHIARVGEALAQAAASGSHVVRKLWANAHGKFSTKGNYAAGAVQGTEWLTEDLCDGTLIRVTRDKVAVTNLVNHRHVEVTTGHHYLAKAP